MGYFALYPELYFSQDAIQILQVIYAQSPLNFVKLPDGVGSPKAFLFFLFAPQVGNIVVPFLDPFSGFL
jgi:hypothetical protein